MLPAALRKPLSYTHVLNQGERGVRSPLDMLGVDRSNR